MKHIAIEACWLCPNHTMKFPDDITEFEAGLLREDDFEDDPNCAPFWGLMMARIEMQQYYCMESDHPPYQFVLAPINDQYSIPDWCPLEDCKKGSDVNITDR